jgi:CPA2 family monovalent cation:H+ antiporter-2
MPSARLSDQQIPAITERPDLEDIRLIIDMVLVLGLALIGGWIAQRLRMPVLVGYVVAGIFIGPNTPGLVANEDRVVLLANLGVAFLMFALGVEFSLRHLLEVRRVALVASAIQYPVTFLLGTLVAIGIGWEIRPALLMGGAFAISSSIVMIKILLGRGEALSPHGRVAFGMGVIQDLSLVPLLSLLPLLSGSSENLLGRLLVSLAQAALALLIVAVVGVRIVPWILDRVARTESRELFLLTIVVIALGTAYASHEAGLSFALGAFLAGLVVSESDFDAQVLAEIIPLRDLFSTLFFVSLGMLLDPDLFTNQPFQVAVVVLALVVGKTLISGAGFLTARVNPLTATMAALLTAQIGEFSFVLAGVGLEEHIISRDQYSLILAAALGSILLAPFIIMLSPVLAPIAAVLPGIPRREAAVDLTDGDHQEPRRHVIICGYGRVGRTLGDALTRRGLQFVVIEINPAIARDLRRQGIDVIYGDSASEAALRRAGAAHARSIAVTAPNLVAAIGTTRAARRINPAIDITTRANNFGEVEELRQAGASEIVQPEFEAGLEFVRHVLRRQGVSSRETQSLVNRRRSQFYAVEEESIYQEG